MFPSQIIKVPSIALSGVVQSHVRWSQYFRITGGQGVAVVDRDTTLYGDYYDIFPRRVVPEAQWFSYDSAAGVGLYMADVYNYFSWQVTANDAQEVQVLGATPTSYRLAIGAVDGSGWMYDPFFYLDRQRCFYVVPAATNAQPTTVSTRRLVKTPAADSTSQVAKTWSRVTLPAGLVNIPQLPSAPTPPTSGPAGGVYWAPNLVHTTTTLTRPTTHTAFTFAAFYHPFVRDVLKELNRFGVEGVYNAQPNRPGSELRRQLESTPYFTTYSPTAVVTTPYPIDEFDFSFEGAYSIYNWELFFHLPFMVATKLAADQQFDAALKWFHYIFNPTEPLAPSSTEPAPQRFWKVKPFYQLTGADTDSQSVVNILSLLLSHDDTDPVRLAARKRLQAQVEEWRQNPFDPDAVARMRPVAYMKAVVIKYLDMLIAWGDSLFSQATRESINEAIQIYVMALKTLGTKPTKLPPITPTALSYDDLSSTLDAFSDACINIEVVLPQVNDDVSIGDADDTPLAARSMYFCVPPNDKLLGYWDTVADRLTKIRNCLSITGEVLNLPLFEPPIDPGVLIAARAAGIDIGSVLADVNSPPPIQRYAVLAQRATELVGEVKSFGGMLLSALEKNDAEALALLRGNQEVELLATQRTVKEWALQDAKDALAAAVASNDSALKKQKYYTSRAFTNQQEALQLSSIGNASDARQVAGVMQAIASAISSVPNIKTGVSGWAGSPVFTIALGGLVFAEILSSAAAVSNLIASANDSQGQSAGLNGSWQRRSDEWVFQADLAASEITQTTAQIAAANDRINQAEQDLAAHDLQFDNSIAARDFMRDKFTNEELYDWMSSQLLALYFQTYKLAYAAAKRAERAWQFELADSSTFLTFGYWESARKGLLAGERLSLDLKRMEMAYLDKDVREFELTSHVPLTMIDPLALEQLRETGTCQVSIPEAFFDAETPGHFLRRIKSVALTIAGVTGPYTPIRCTLTLVSSSVRTQASVGATPVPSTAAVQAIVTSTAREDAGLFETNLRDERYLPFERAGAISTWRLELPPINPTPPSFTLPIFDYHTISDVVLHMRYTARDGGSVFRGNVNTQSSSQLHQALWKIGFSAKSAFSDAWYRFISPGAFAPTQLSGLVSWHRSDLGVATSGSNVTSWADQSGNGYTLTPTASPTLITSEPTLGGQPAIQLNGTSQYFTFGGSPTARTACDVFAVYVCTASSGRAPVWSNRGAAIPSGGTNLYFGENGGVGYALSDNLPTTGGGATISGGGAFNTLMVQEASFEQSSGLYTLWVNGAQTASNNFTPGSTTANIDLVNGLVGKDGSEFFTGKLAELIVFNRRLTDAERAQVTAYLQARYAPTGLTLALDTDHVPFRSSGATIYQIDFVRMQKTITGGAFSATLNGPSTSVAANFTSSTSTYNNQSTASSSALAVLNNPGKALGSWTLLTDPSKFTADDDLIVVVSYRTNWT